MSKWLIHGLILLAFIIIHVSCASGRLPEVAAKFSSRGQAKLIIDKDYSGAIEDFTYAIHFNSQDSYSYLGRGIAFQKMGNITSAHEDFKKGRFQVPSATGE